MGWFRNKFLSMMAATQAYLPFRRTRPFAWSDTTSLLHSFHASAGDLALS